MSPSPDIKLVLDQISSIRQCQRLYTLHTTRQPQRGPKNPPWTVHAFDTVQPASTSPDVLVVMDTFEIRTHHVGGCTFDLTGRYVAGRAHQSRPGNTRALRVHTMGQTDQALPDTRIRESWELERTALFGNYPIPSTENCKKDAMEKWTNSDAGA